MEHCDYCGEVISKMYALEKQVTSLKCQLEIAETQVKILREENTLLKSNIKVPNKPRRQNLKTKSEIQSCYEEIEKLQQIIRHKDEIIQNQVRCDDISESGTDTLTKEIDTEACRKKVRI